jgi:hypothetical protein
MRSWTPGCQSEMSAKSRLELILRGMQRDGRLQKLSDVYFRIQRSNLIRKWIAVAVFGVLLSQAIALMFLPNKQDVKGTITAILAVLMLVFNPLDNRIVRQHQAAFASQVPQDINELSWDELQILILMCEYLRDNLLFSPPEIYYAAISRLYLDDEPVEVRKVRNVRLLLDPLLDFSAFRVTSRERMFTLPDGRKILGSQYLTRTLKLLPELITDEEAGAIAREIRLGLPALVNLGEPGYVVEAYKLLAETLTQGPETRARARSELLRASGESHETSELLRTVLTQASSDDLLHPSFTRSEVGAVYPTQPVSVETSVPQNEITSSVGTEQQNN